MKKKVAVVNFATSLKVGPPLNLLKALGDSLVCIGTAGDEVSLLDGTVAALGYLIIEKADEVGEALGVL